MSTAADLLRTAADRLDDLNDDGDTGTIQLAADLRRSEFVPPVWLLTQDVGHGGEAIFQRWRSSYPPPTRRQRLRWRLSKARVSIARRIAGAQWPDEV